MLSKSRLIVTCGCSIALLIASGCRQTRGYRTVETVDSVEVVETPTGRKSKPYFKVQNVGSDAVVRGVLMNDHTYERERRVVVTSTKYRQLSGPPEAGTTAAGIVTVHMLGIFTLMDLLPRLVGANGLGPRYERNATYSGEIDEYSSPRFPTVEAAASTLAALGSETDPPEPGDVIKTVVRRPNYFHRLGHFFPRFIFFTPYFGDYSIGKSRELHARNDIRSIPLESIELAEPMGGVRFDVALLDARGQEITTSSGQTSDQGAFEIHLTESLTAKVPMDQPFELEISYPDADPWTAELGILDHPPYVVSRRLWEAHRREQELIPKAVAGDEEATVELIGLWLTLPTEENAEDARNWLRELGRRNLAAKRPATALLYLGMDRDLLEDPDSRVLGDIRNCTAEIIAGDEYTIAVVPASDTPSGEETELLSRFASYNWREAASAITRVDSPEDARIVVQISRATANIAPSTAATDEAHTYQDGMKFVDNPAYSRALSDLSSAQSQLRMAESAAAANRAASQSLAASGGMNNMGRAAAVAGGAASGASVALAQQAVREAQADLATTPKEIQVENIVTRNLPTQTTTVRGYLTGEVVTKPNAPTIRAQRFPLSATVEVSDEHWDADPTKDFPANPLVLPSTDAVRTQLLDKGFEAVRDKVRDVLVSEAALRSLMKFDEARESGDRETIIEAGLRFLYVAGADHPDRTRVTREVEEHIGGLTGDKTTVGALITALRTKY